MYRELDIEEYLESDQKVPLIDVRSPAEYAKAHIPGAISMPLFDDLERAEIGLLYVQTGRQQAIDRGLELASPKMATWLQQAREMAQNNTGKHGLILHCWRGGMRSASMATLFDFAGIPTSIIKGGYKAYRNAVREIFELPWQLIILGGRTGSGKTKILQSLAEAGEQVIDLEALAHHKGSAFGDLGEEAQPSTEMFENRLCAQLQNMDLHKRIWLEDESHLIGTVFLPESMWQKMRSAPLVYCRFTKEERIRYLVDTYGHFETEAVVRSVQKIARKLGGQHAKEALEKYHAGDPAGATEIVLTYYDKTYDHGTSKRDSEKILTLDMEKIEPHANAKEILSFVASLQTEIQE